MKLETERLLIRDLQLDDVEPLASLWSDPEVTRFMGGPRNYDRLVDTIAADASLPEPPSLDLWPVLERASGSLVGNCGLLEKEVEGRAEVELVYLIAYDAWGRGYATEAAAAVRDHALGVLGLSRLIALIKPENAASERVAEKLGMQLERDVERRGGVTMRLYVLERIEQV